MRDIIASPINVKDRGLRKARNIFIITVKIYFMLKIKITSSVFIQEAVDGELKHIAYLS